MDYQDAFDRLWNHANMRSSRFGPEDSFLDTAHHAGEAPDARARLQRLYDDILSCLASVNVALNGAVASEEIGGSSSPVDRRLCYAVSGILSGGWSRYYEWWRIRTADREFLDDFASMLVHIGIAWDLVLAGDSDDIVTDTEQQSAAEQT